MKKWMILIVALFVGCTSSESIETKTYLLPNIKPEHKLGFDEVSVQMPSYLEGPGIVYRLSETEIEVASHHVWAGNLRNMLVDQLQQYQMPEASSGTKLSVRFERFNGSYTGNAELKGHWQLGSQNGDFDIKQPLDDEGYDALVLALSQGVSSLMIEVHSKQGKE
ncbi:hypothetical protein VIN01S_16100 [Vibrio inusitatus NBRC 102082]|uniref:ABC-type transport auxiliary lipoprotein component domain-containing protein n=1 Tax=Vibrio inusitatus NBRC 102082 TaxID=1219070 RepID=A0A4Y3HUQ0_9VIBR|nr:ABC-type transport auxiliary lipoprotein family protein [Vibrio inusitatus]GEA50806.1 hypothetical protein VIN01S_16100 [Vibrio inusitatus NBRC 102082]